MLKEEILEEIIRLEYFLKDYTDAEFRANFPSETRLLLGKSLDLYAMEFLKECLPERWSGIGMGLVQDEARGFNRCRDEALKNANKK